MKHFFIFLFLISCRSTNTPHSGMLSDQYKSHFNIALKHLENERYEQAVKGFSALANQTRNIPQDISHWSALFNLGSAYEKLKNCKKSEEIFSDLSAKIKNDNAFLARTLLRLHYAYDCLSQPEKALMTLKDVEQRAHTLNEISRAVEIPARFSILYAQLNKPTSSMKFQNRAFQGIKKIKSPIKDPQLLIKKGAEIFYIMGRSFSSPRHIQLKYYLQALPIHQIYLIQSFLLSDPFWTPLAQKELFLIYENLGKVYKKLSKNQKTLHKNKITKSLGDLQRIALESESSELNKIKTQIVDAVLAQIKQ